MHIDDESLVTTSWWTTSTGPHAWSPEFRRPLDYGIKDYDLGYFDASGLSYEAEDVVIRRVKATFDDALRSMVEVRNQARVHLWFEAKFSEPYGPPDSWRLSRPQGATTATAI